MWCSRINYVSRINVLFSLQGANILLTDGGDVKLGKVHMHIVHVCNPDVYQCVCVYVLNLHVHCVSWYWRKH